MFLFSAAVKEKKVYCQGFHFVHSLWRTAIIPAPASDVDVISELLTECFLLRSNKEDGVSLTKKKKERKIDDRRYGVQIRGKNSFATLFCFFVLCNLKHLILVPFFPTLPSFLKENQFLYLMHNIIPTLTQAVSG